MLAAALPLLAACVSLTADPRALISDPAGVNVQSLYCDAAIVVARSFGATASAGGADAVDPNAIRLMTWNLHKQDDAGWQEDLAQFARSNDFLLLQEVSLLDSLQAILANAGLRWVLASSFIYELIDVGVLTATRIPPVANCTQRTVEPILRIPKSAVITWLRVAGTPQLLAIANVHAINFTLTVDDYQAQLAALADVLADHRGPLVLGGDFNTWSDERSAALRDVAARLELVEVTYVEDRRAMFLGRQVDHLFIRGLEVVASQVTAVTSSDHNPIEVILRLAR